MKSIRTTPTVHAAEGDERIRTAVPALGTDSAYEHRSVERPVPSGVSVRDDTPGTLVPEPLCDGVHHWWSYPGCKWAYEGQPCDCGERVWKPAPRGAAS